MEKPLDEDFIINLETLKIGTEGSGFLHVNQALWKEELYRLERKANLGCVILFFVTVILTFFSIFGNGLILLVVMVLGFIYNRIHAIRFNNLRMHGAYQYEIYEDRVVRYSNSRYRKFQRSDNITIKQKKYGVLISQKKKVRNFFLNHVNPNIIVIPNKTQGYQQIVKHLNQWQTK